MQSASRHPEIIQACQPLLDRFTARIAAYLQADSEHPRIWRPAYGSDENSRWSANKAAALEALQIPALPDPEDKPYRPDLLLHRLGQLESLDDTILARLASVVDSDSHSLIVNTSGTGKTRLVLEVLSRSWGLYLTCRASRLTDPYGSLDLGSALTSLPSFEVDGRVLHRRVVLQGPGSSSADDHLRHNRSIAHSLTYSVLLARLLVFNHFCAIADNLEIPEPVLRRRWLLLQLRPDFLLRNDPFSLISRRLNAFPLDGLVSETKIAFAPYGSRLQFVALDEAQVAVSTSSLAFASADRTTNAPVLREIVHCVASVFQRQRIVVAGTRCDPRIVDDALSGLASLHKGFEHVYALGSFDNIQKVSAYLRHFFGTTFTDRDCASLYRLFQGRHRFLTVYVFNLLILGEVKKDAVMNSLHHALTGDPRWGRSICLPYNLIVENSQLDESRVSRQARRAAFRYALLRQPTTFSEEAAHIVALGLGPFCDSGLSAVVFEPLVFYRLVGWLRESTQSDIGGLIRHRLRVPGAFMRGMDIAAGFAAYLWELFTGAEPSLDNILEYQGPPLSPDNHPAALLISSQLQDHTFSLPLPSDISKRRRVSGRTTTRKETSLPRRVCFQSFSYAYTVKPVPVIKVARTPDEVFEWLRSPEEEFLIPDDSFGADLLFFLRVEAIGKVLVAAFIDPFADIEPKPTSWPGDLSSFYANSPENHDKLLSFLGHSRPRAHRKTRHQLNMLRMICCVELPATSCPVPTVTLNMEKVLSLRHAPELTFSALDSITGWRAI
ncbi:hypothetical protein AURDEDRAFT_147354 [Auricularia subglabra TFB-10046 SS5]|nr:hypothetical protein AURDEDRAFT_147354 [Auricularia subglabra TFB-10046 SS5]